MPEKICECGQKCHVRVKICPKCNKEFEKKIKKEKVEKIDESITVGNWAKDKTKGLPEIVIPEPLIGTSLSNEEIKSYISYEGLGYCLLTYIDAKKISDNKLKELWIDAKSKLKEIIQYLY
jgi:hypothetical protein